MEKTDFISTEEDIVNLNASINSAYDLNEEIYELIKSVASGEIDAEQIKQLCIENAGISSAVQTLLSNAMAISRKLAEQI